MYILTVILIYLDDLYILLQQNKNIAFISSQDYRAERDFSTWICCKFFKLATLGNQNELLHETSLKSFLDAMFVGHNARTLIKVLHDMFSGQNDDTHMNSYSPLDFANYH